MDFQLITSSFKWVQTGDLFTRSIYYKLELRALQVKRKQFYIAGPIFISE